MLRFGFIWAIALAACVASTPALANEFADVKVVAFDVFGTVFDFDGVERQEIRDYVAHVREAEWKPLSLPKSWETMKAHADSVEGIERLRTKYIVVTCSNGNLGLLAKMAKNAGISWDAIIPLELNRVYKPNVKAYQTVCEVLGVEPHEVLMVTANETSGDLEAPLKIGMKTMEIRGESGPATITELADLLGCDK